MEQTEDAEFTTEHRRITKTHGGHYHSYVLKCVADRPAKRAVLVVQRAQTQATSDEVRWLVSGLSARPGRRWRHQRRTSVRLRYPSWLRCELRMLRLSPILLVH